MIANIGSIDSDHRFGAAILRRVLHQSIGAVPDLFWPSVEAGLRELYRVLSPGGRLGISVRIYESKARLLNPSRYGLTDDQIQDMRSTLERRRKNRLRTSLAGIGRSHALHTYSSRDDHLSQSRTASVSRDIASSRQTRRRGSRRPCCVEGSRGRDIAAQFSSTQRRTAAGHRPASVRRAGGHNPERAETRLASTNLRKTSRGDQIWQILDRFCRVTVDERRERQVGQQPGRPLEINNEQSAARLEDSADFSKTTLLQFSGQVVHHHAAQHDVDARVGEWQSFDACDAVVNVEPRARCFVSSNGDHFVE